MRIVADIREDEVVLFFEPVPTIRYPWKVDNRIKYPLNQNQTLLETVKTFKIWG